MKLLIVDDEEATCLGMKARITDMQFSALETIDIAFSAEQALEYARERRVDILLTDVRMVDMNGLELINAVRKLYPHACCIIMTAYKQFEYAHEAIKLGIHDFLLKPFSMEELHSAIEHAITQVLEQTGANLGEIDILIDPIAWSMAYVKEHLPGEINMAVVANELNLSYSYFSKAFKKQTGLSFSDYISNEKMKLAAQYLGEGRKTGDIAAQLGYINTQNFSRAFERYWACTPGDYRIRIRKNQ